MGWSGSNTRKTNLIKKGNSKKYQIDESKLWKGLSDVQKSEYIINVGLDEYLLREELPKEKYASLLTHVKTNNQKEYTATFK